MRRAYAMERARRTIYERYRSEMRTLITESTAARLTQWASMQNILDLHV
jgi:hypothetical protein